MQEGPMKKQLIHSLGNSTGMGMLGSEGAFAHAYKLGNFVYMTGQTGFTLDGELVGPYDPAAQARQACENIKALMEMAGGTIDDVIKVIVYVTEREYRAESYPIIRSYFKVRPCGTGVVVDGLARPELVLEIDAWGFIDDPE
jgi:enamine deaminase RidA (YjgF/YER057c/UK114 family)